MIKKPKKVEKKPLKQPRKSNSQSEGTKEPEKLAYNLDDNVRRFKQLLKDCSDVIFREFTIGSHKIRGVLIYVDGLVNLTLINDQILKAAMHQFTDLELTAKEIMTDSRLLESIKELVVTAGEVKEEQEVLKAIITILSGDTILLVDGLNTALMIGAKGWESRGVDEPGTEALIRGPREGFTENIRTNTALLRRRLRDPNLKMVAGKIGRRTQTDIVVAYLEGIVNVQVLDEVKRRLNTIDTDYIFDSGNIEQYIEDSSLSPFPQVQSTERPDKAAAALLEGRVVILVDGTPFVLIAPATFAQFFQSPEDYYERWIISSLTRIVRFGASYIAAFTPAAYIAVTSYHPGLMPTKLALAIAATREGIPFPAIVEALIMEVAFELFREAGARLPRPIGQTVGIVGGLIVGEAAVTANLASPIMIIVVALTAIASFSIPAYNLATGFRMVRFPLMIAAATLGLYGVVLGFIVINVHMVSMRSFGTVYLSPFAPYTFTDWKDLVIRAPLRAMRTRPEQTEPQDVIRQQNKKPEGW